MSRIHSRRTARFLVAALLWAASLVTGAQLVTGNSAYSQRPESIERKSWQTKEPYRIVVGPNIRASNVGDFPHGESDVAAHPTNPLNLLGSAISFTNAGVGAGYETNAYTSKDG